MLDDPLVHRISAVMDAVERRGAPDSRPRGWQRADTQGLVWGKTPQGAVRHLLGRHCAVWAEDPAPLGSISKGDSALPAADHTPGVRVVTRIGHHRAQGSAEGLTLQTRFYQVVCL